MTYTLWRISHTNGRPKYTSQGSFERIDDALSSLPGRGWGWYILTDGDGRRVANVRLFAPSQSESLPLEPARDQQHAPAPAAA